MVADLWTGSRVVKNQLLQALSQTLGSLYTEQNVVFAGTHTHSGPGGYTGSMMYDFSAGGLDSHTVQCIVTGCVDAMKMAHANLGPGRIYVNRGNLTDDCGRQRSNPAYNLNPMAERLKYGTNMTDKEMLLLKFTRVDASGNEKPAGVLKLVRGAPDRPGQQNTHVTGDNKGWAATLFEQQQGSDQRSPGAFVAAFANSNAGDVSPSVELGHPPDGVGDKAQMQKHGQQQFNFAKQLFAAATEQLTGPVDFRHTYVNFSNVTLPSGTASPGVPFGATQVKRTYRAALGLSFAAGSREDSVPDPDIGVLEGITDTFTDLLRWVAAYSYQLAAVRMALSTVFGLMPWNTPDPALAAGHSHKLIAFVPSDMTPSAVPEILPVQLLRIGPVAVVGIPGEITTMAGRRLRQTILDAMSGAGVKYVALAAFANDYAQYITTFEEYQSQQYEGASTLFGPYTLEAHQQVAKGLATAMVTGSASPAGATPEAFSAPPQARYRFRNLSSSDVHLLFYKPEDKNQTYKLPNGDKIIGAGREYSFSELEFTGATTQTVYQAMPSGIIEQVAVHHGVTGANYMMRAGQLLTIAADGSISVGSFTVPSKR